MFDCPPGYFVNCNVLYLISLSVLPLQNIRKRTAEGDEQHSSLSSIIKAVELSISKWTTLILNEWDACILCFEIQILALVKIFQDIWPSFLMIFCRGIGRKSEVSSKLWKVTRTSKQFSLAFNHWAGSKSFYTRGEQPFQWSPVQKANVQFTMRFKTRSNICEEQTGTREVHEQGS